MRERLSHVGVICWAALVETVRRQDLYVIWILAVCGLGGGHVLGSVGVKGMETFLRSITFTVVNVLSTLICIWLAARQLPEEISRRTLFPLLARPVRRFDVLLGKFLAVWVLSAGALLVLALIAWINLTLAHAAVGPIFWEYLVLRILSFAPIVALTILFSLLMSGPAAVVISILVTFFGMVFARTLADIIKTAPGTLQAVAKGIYFLFPHLDLFDLSQRASFNYPPVPLWTLGFLTLYALAYVAVFLGLGELRFRRMAV